METEKQTPAVLGYSPTRRINIRSRDIEAEVHWRELEEKLRGGGIEFVSLRNIKVYKAIVLYDPVRVLCNLLFKCKFVKWRETLLRDCPDGYLPKEVYEVVLKVKGVCDHFEHKHLSLEASIVYCPLTMTKVFLMVSFGFDGNLFVRRCVYSWSADMDLLNALSS